MIGTVIEGKPKIPRRIWILLVVAIITVISGVMEDKLILATVCIPFILPVMILLLSRTPAIRVEALPEGLMVAHPPQVIPWNELTTVRRQWQHQNPRKETQACSLEVHHHHGVLLIPAPMTPPSQQVFKEFFEFVPASGSRELPAVLQEHLVNWRNTFGDDKVFSFVARHKLQYPTMTKGMKTFLGMFVGLLIMWIVIAVLPAPLPKRGEPDDRGVMAGITVGIILVSFLFVLRGSAQQNIGGHRSIKNWKQAGLIISPAGLAMSQGKSEGEMKWAEVLDIQFQKKANQGIKIKVAGAEFQIFDLYDRPFYLIYQHLMRYWANKDV